MSGLGYWLGWLDGKVGATDPMLSTYSKVATFAVWLSIFGGIIFTLVYNKINLWLKITTKILCSGCWKKYDLGDKIELISKKKSKDYPDVYLCSKCIERVSKKKKK